MYIVHNGTHRYCIVVSFVVSCRVVGRCHLRKCGINGVAGSMSAFALDFEFAVSNEQSIIMYKVLLLRRY